MELRNIKDTKDESRSMNCPKCKSTNTIPIAYGYPGKALWKDADQEKVHLGGCCIEMDNPEWPDRHCRDCGHYF